MYIGIVMDFRFRSSCTGSPFSGAKHVDIISWVRWGKLVFCFRYRGGSHAVSEVFSMWRNGVGPTPGGWGLRKGNYALKERCA